jgi:tetraacyldisaccharide 4'-kinase
MQAWLTRRWYEGSAPLSLLPLSWIYAGAIALRTRGYSSGFLRSYEVGTPVLVVGNLTVGGTGKTPLVIWLARQLKALGLRPGIVSRGYRRTGAEPVEVNGDSDWRLVGDEPLLIQRHTGCPTIVAADRVEGARRLSGRGVDLILADDGLQHLRLRRGCEIAVVDGARGMGNGALLPAGPLREPASRLHRVDAIVVNGPTKATFVPSADAFSMSLVAGHPSPVAALSGGTCVADPATLRGQRVHAVAGIGNPTRFFADLRARGMEPIEHPFPDHHAFLESDLDFGDGLPVLMTEKDAVKCLSFSLPRLWYVPVAASFPEEQGRALLDRVLRKLGLTVSSRG